MLNKIVFASKNPGKIREVANLLEPLGIEIISVPKDFDPAENADTFEGNALIKAKAAAKIMNIPSLADDSGLMVDYLEGAPGVHSSRYAENDAARIEKLLNALQKASHTERTARFVCAMVLVDKDGEILYSTKGICEGEIINQKRGNDGFGYDPIFYIPDLNKTMAEIPLQEKNTLSHRALALRKMIHWVKENHFTKV